MENNIIAEEVSEVIKKVVEDSTNSDVNSSVCAIVDASGLS